MGHENLRAGISLGQGGDIFGQKRKYLPAKPHKGLTDKVHIVVIIPPTGNIYIMIATVTIGFIVTVAIVLLNLYVDVVVS